MVNIYKPCQKEGHRLHRQEIVSCGFEARLRILSLFHCQGPMQNNTRRTRGQEDNEGHSSKGAAIFLFRKERIHKQQHRSSSGVQKENGTGSLHEKKRLKKSLDFLCSFPLIKESELHSEMVRHTEAQRQKKSSYFIRSALLCTHQLIVYLMRAN